MQSKQHQTTYCNSSTAKPKKPKHNQESVGCGSAAGKAVRNARSHLRQPQQRIIHRGHVAVVKLHDCVRKKTCERCVCVCVSWGFGRFWIKRLSLCTSGDKFIHSIPSSMLCPALARWPMLEAGCSLDMIFKVQ